MPLHAQHPCTALDHRAVMLAIETIAKTCSLRLTERATQPQAVLRSVLTVRLAVSPLRRFPRPNKRTSSFRFVRPYGGSHRELSTDGHLRALPGTRLPSHL